MVWGRMCNMTACRSTWPDVRALQPGGLLWWTLSLLGSIFPLVGAGSGCPTPQDHQQLGGSQGFLRVGPEAALSAAAQAHAECGETVVWMGWERTLAGFIALRDEPSPTAAEALSWLEAAGVRPVMLSGDNPRTLRVIADSLDLKEYEGGRSP